MYLGKQTDIFVRLYDYAYESMVELPAVGIAYDDILVEIWRQGGDTFEVVDINAEMWLELGNGYYILKLDPSYLNTIGPIAIRISGNMIQDFIKEDFVKPMPVEMVPILAKCVVFGNIVDLGGNTDRQSEVTARLVNIPTQIGGSTLISGNKIKTVTDAYGNFSMQLLRNAIVMIEIPMVGIRCQVTIPDQENINILDLLPPIP